MRNLCIFLGVMFMVDLHLVKCNHNDDKSSPLSQMQQTVLCEKNVTDLRKCNQTDYEEYKKCVDTNKFIRGKREACNEIQKTCQAINAACLSKCGQNINCKQSCPVCPSNANLLSIKALEENAKLQRLEKPDSEIIARINPGNHINENNQTIVRVYHDREIELHENASHLFDFKHVLNSTNVIHIPLNITTNTAHRIYVYANQSSAENNKTNSEFKVLDKAASPCCWVIRAKSCYMSSTGVRCHHGRHKTCGPQCTSNIIHAQVRRRCIANGECTQRIAYVPQPERPKCIYIDQWPYVACQIGHHLSGKSCHGCYDHYGYGFEKFYRDDSIAHHCRFCYDNAFDIGPLYRRGPFLRPYYYHQPPCYITGLCYVYPIIDCGYGCFGHDRIDPAWGVAMENEGYDIDYDDDLDDNETDKVENKTSTTGDNDWGVHLHKCKVVSDDGTFEIKNCSDSNIEDNPYATKPLNSEYREPRMERNRHIRSHSRHGPADFQLNGDEPEDDFENVGYEDDENENLVAIPPRFRHQKLRQHKLKGRKHSKRRVDIIYDDEEI